MRSLGRAGVPVIACDHDPRALGLLSRYSTPARTADPLAEPEVFVEDVLALGRRLPAPGVLFATHDEALSALGPHEDRLEGLFHRPWSPWPVLRPVMDKAAQHEAARSIGFPVPGSVVPRDERDAIAAVRNGGLRVPVILKARDAPGFRRHFRAQVLRAEDEEGLRRAYAAAARFDPQLCEVIPGGDDRLWTLGSYRDASLRPLASFTGRKLAQWPPIFGSARVAEARWDPDLAARCHALLDALGFHGISQVEVKRDPRDGRDHLIEVNARAWMWIGLATACGVNIPHACYLDAIGRPRRWPEGHAGGRRWTLLGKHLAATPADLRARRLTPRAAAASLRPPLMDGVIDPRDPRPAIAGYRRAAGHLARRLRGRRAA